MNIREFKEEQEEFLLSNYASKSRSSKGRKKITKKCEIRTDFERDRDRIIHSKAFRRLMHKTQVFIAPEGDHFRTRLTHTLEVSQISRTISRALNLNEDLTEAIALGHDLGHTPFGHVGEAAIGKLLNQPFYHNEQSIRVVEKIENNNKGLNLTHEVLDGILNHPTRCTPNTLEGKVVQLSDKIAYINHDIDDAIRANMLIISDFPEDCINILGDTSSKRIDFLVKNIIENSAGKSEIIIDRHAKLAMDELRKFLFDNVYLVETMENERFKIEKVINEIYEYYFCKPEKIPQEFYSLINEGEEKQRVIIDYIACMTDRFCLRLYSNLYLPNQFTVS